MKRNHYTLLVKAHPDAGWERIVLPQFADAAYARQRAEKHYKEHGPYVVQAFRVEREFGRMGPWRMTPVGPDLGV